MTARYKTISLLAVIAGILIYAWTSQRAYGQEEVFGSQDPEIVVSEVFMFDAPEDALLEPSGTLGVSEQAPYTMNYQGFLAGAGGNPVTQVVTVRAALFDAPTGGTQVWGREVHTGVSVLEGIFNITLGQNLLLRPSVFQQAVYLELQVQTTVLPRQPVRSVAHAYSLVPGAQVYGVPSGSIYGFQVINTGTSTTARGAYAEGSQYGLYSAATAGTGIYATGTQYGLRAAVTAGDTSIKSDQYVMAQGYRSAADSYIWINGNQGIAGIPTGQSEPFLETNFGANGQVILRNTAAGVGTRLWYVPIALPSVLMGQNVTVKQITVYYATSNTNAWIDDTNLYRFRGSLGQSDSIIINGTNRTDVAGGSYTLTATTNNVLDLESGPLNLQLILRFPNNLETITIGAIRVRLGHQ